MRKELEPKQVTLYPWNMSVTGQWGEDSGLDVLRSYAHGDVTASELAEWLWEPGAFVQNGAIIELLGHGNHRQAVVLVREFLTVHPVMEKTLKDQFGPHIDHWREGGLEQYPSGPHDFPLGVEVRFVPTLPPAPNSK